MTFPRWQSLLVSPMMVGAIALSASAQSVPDVAGLSDGGALNAMDQVTSVSQLSDVKPTDWAFQALQSLVERYGCIAGYPDKTYRGNRAMTRYEFAAGLNACMDRVNELIGAGTADLVKKEDLEALKKLQEEFAAELATLRGRVDALEARTATLEKQQFSTTTKLNGEVIFGLAGIASGEGPGRGDTSKNTVLGDRVRINFDTSFTGKDLLRTRLQATNLDPFSDSAGTSREGDLRFAGGDNGNSLGIDALLYQFPLGEKTTVIIEANAGAADDFADTLNPYLDGDGGSGALSHFGTRNPIYYYVDGTGIALRHSFSDALEFSLGYLVPSDISNNPASENGLFDGAYAAIAQLTFKPNDKIAVGLTYINSYGNDISQAGGVGSDRASIIDFTGQLTSTNAFGVGVSFKFNPSIVLNASAGYSSVDARGISGSADIWNWQVGLAFPDLGKKGNLAGLIVGMEPKVTGSNGALGVLLGEDRDTSLHIEGFYQYRLNDNISITPGIIWITAPDHDNRNEDAVIGAVRATFTF
jgi:Carbohydrate-selective porin, OprB family/S-layer homology domain